MNSVLLSIVIAPWHVGNTFRNII